MNLRPPGPEPDSGSCWILLNSVGRKRLKWNELRPETHRSLISVELRGIDRRKNVYIESLHVLNLDRYLRATPPESDKTNRICQSLSTGILKPDREFESTPLRHAVWDAEKPSANLRKIARNRRNFANLARKPDWRKFATLPPR